MNPDMFVFFHQVFMNVYNIADINSIITDRKSKQSVSFSCYRLENLLKNFPNSMNMVLFQRPLLTTNGFVHHYHTKICWLHQLLPLSQYHQIGLLDLHQETGFFLLSVCFGEVLSTPQITIFLPYSPIDNKNYERASNLIP